MSPSLKRSNQSGFTLVELAIVLMIIGLLIGGILRGQEMMENARVTSTTQQIKAFDSATTSFRDMYNALPGDIADPTTAIANCTGDCATAGNGNGVIGTAATTRTGTYDTPAAGVEGRRYWLHLAMAKLISGVDPSPSSYSATWNGAYPQAKISGAGFHAFSANIPASGTVPAIVGPSLILRASPTGNGLSETTAAPINPIRGGQFDRRLDDGSPDTGDVVGVGTGCTGTSYTAGDAPACNLLFKIQN